MPAVSIPAVPGAGSYQLLGSPYQQTLAGGVDFNSAAYYGAVSETLVVGRTGAHGASATVGVPGAPHLILTCSQPQPPAQQQQHTIVPGHQTQFTTTGSTPQGTYYTVPASTPTPPLAITQPPPSSQHHHQQQAQQQHQPAVFYTSNIGNPLTYPVTVSNPSSSSASTLKSVPTSFIQTQYRPSTPPQQQQQQQLHPHHLQQPQSTVIASSNGHHPAHLTLNYSQPVPFNPGQPVGPVAAAQGSQLVTFQPNSYQVSRPVGTAVIQLAGNPIVQAQQPQPGAQVQPYQLLRPAGALSGSYVIVIIHIVYCIFLGGGVVFTCGRHNKVLLYMMSKFPYTLISLNVISYFPYT